MSVVAATVGLGGLVGPAAAGLANRFLDAPRTAFAAFCLVGLTLYGVLAFIRADATSTALWLNAMHLVAAVPIVGSLMLALPASPPTPRDLAETGDLQERVL